VPIKGLTADYANDEQMYVLSQAIAVTTSSLYNTSNVINAVID